MAFSLGMEFLPVHGLTSPGSATFTTPVSIKKYTAAWESANETCNWKICERHFNVNCSG